MSIREENKKETRQRLLDTAKQEFVAQGLFRISTAEIAARAGVAHGTVFFHFQNKENLIIEVLDRELLRISDELNLLLHGSHDVETLLNRYLDFLEGEEAFFAVLARETPLYSPPLRRKVLGREAAIREYFHQALQTGIQQGQFKKVDITTVLNILFGTLNYYLSLREVFVSEGSVIDQKRELIISTFILLLQK